MTLSPLPVQALYRQFLQPIIVIGRFDVLQDGKYSAWFRAEGGEGMGVIELSKGRVSGGDTILSYFGTYTQAGDTFYAHIRTQRHSPGNAPLFGIDELEIDFVGTSKDRTAAGSGAVKQLPGVSLNITLVRIES